MSYISKRQRLAFNDIAAALKAQEKLESIWVLFLSRRWELKTTM